MTEIECDILIVGGGVGGVAASLAASTYGLKIITTEEYPWIGGQLTSQGVPPDEHPWIETIGCTAAYRDFRNRVRLLYEQTFPLRDGMRGTPFNPGGGFVSGLCHEPRIAHTVLLEMLAKPISTGSLVVKTGFIPVEADVEKEFVRAVSFRNLLSGGIETITAKIVLDCTELGDLLPLTRTEYVSGAESVTETGELHATNTANPDDVQGFTWCLAAGYDPSGNHTIDQPSSYGFWRSFQPSLIDSSWPGRLLDWTAVNPMTLASRMFDLFPQPQQPYNSLWNYRKIVSSSNLGTNSDDITLINWPQNDYFIRNIIDRDPNDVNVALEESRQLSLSLLYWMQTEAPRPDGGVGYPGLYPAPGVLGTDDGLAMAPYIRESRRISALFTMTEAHVGTAMRSEMGFNRAEYFDDSVGLGSYRIDLHPTPTGRNYVDISSLPFQISLGSLLPIRMRNLIAGAKNIGVTHITNGCYRLHPVEWNIGESAGHLAAYSITRKLDIKEIYETTCKLQAFQEHLIANGIELKWPDEIAVSHR